MGTKPQILLLEPNHFDVSYRINPWMRPESWAHDSEGLRAEAAHGFDRLQRALIDAGCETIVLPAQRGLPDMVFTANAAIVLNGHALMARFRYPERQAEEPHWRTLFAGLQADGRLREISELPEGCYQEGAGDCVWDARRQWFWAAHGPRSILQSHAIIAQVFDQEVVTLELATEQSYHLDVCLCPLEGGEVLYYPPAFTASSLALLRDRVPSKTLIPAAGEDVARFGVNAVNIGRTIILAGVTATLRGQLEERGYRVVEVGLAPYLLSGGGAWCMTLRLDRCSTDFSPS